MSIQLWNQGVYRQWTEREDKIIMGMAGKFSPAEIAKVINRSKRAVHCRAQWMGVSLKYHSKFKSIVSECRQLRQQGKGIPLFISIKLGMPARLVADLVDRAI